MLFFCKITSHLAITQGGVTLIQPLQYATEASQKDILIFYAMIVTTKMYPNFTFDRKLSLMTQNCPYMTENYFAIFILSYQCYTFKTIIPTQKYF